VQMRKIFKRDLEEGPEKENRPMYWREYLFYK
jgi:hypothetical protein